MKSLSCVRLCVTLWIVAYQASPSMGFSRQEYWSGLPFPSSGDLPNHGNEPGSPALETYALTSEPPGKPLAKGEGNSSQLLYSCLENPVDRGAWWPAVHGFAQSWTRLKQLSTHVCIGEGNGNPLQYFCLENPRDRGVWWAAVYGVSQSWAGLKRLSSSRILKNGIAKSKTKNILSRYCQVALQKDIKW